MYLVTIDPEQGRLVEVRLIPTRVKQFRVNRASEADAIWLCNLLNTLGAPFGARVRLKADTSMIGQITS